MNVVWNHAHADTAVPIPKEVSNAIANEDTFYNKMAAHVFVSINPLSVMYTASTIL